MFVLVFVDFNSCYPAFIVFEISERMIQDILFTCGVCDKVFLVNLGKDSLFGLISLARISLEWFEDELPVD